MRDEVYSKSQRQIVDFAFNEDVAAVFPDMIRRSVMGYETMIPVTGLAAAQHLGKNGTAFDLGCSLGATTLAILQQNSSPDIRIIGIDNSAPMINGARQAIKDPRAQFRVEDIRETGVNEASVVVLNLVLQFLDVDERLPLLKRLRKQMTPRGLLIVSEKVRHEDPAEHAYFDRIHLAWKKANGYTELEIAQKRSALENVMKIDTEAEHVQRFNSAGFSQVTQWYRCMNWASFLVQP